MEMGKVLSDCHDQDNEPYKKDEDIHNNFNDFPNNNQDFTDFFCNSESSKLNEFFTINKKDIKKYRKRRKDERYNILKKIKIHLLSYYHGKLRSNLYLKNIIPKLKKEYI